MFVVALLASMCFGAALPGFCLLFGEMIDSVGGQGGSNSFDTLSSQALIMVYIGIGVYVFSFLQISMFSMFSENISHKIKV